MGEVSRQRQAEWVSRTYVNLKQSSRDPVPLTAKAGSVSFRSSYLVHAAQPFENKNVDSVGGWGIISIVPTMTIGAKRRVRCRGGAAQTI